MRDDKLIAKKCKAFTLVEVMVALMASILLFAWLPYAAYTGLIVILDAEDRLLAQERIRSVLTIITSHAEMCGFGMPRGGGDFIAAFAPTSEPLAWGEPLSVIDARMDIYHPRESGVCRMLYAVPAAASPIRTLQSVASSDDVFRVNVSGMPDGIETDSPFSNTTKSWVLFASSGSLPAEATAMSTLSDGTVLITLRKKDSSRAVVVHANEEVFCLRSVSMAAYRSSDPRYISEAAFRTDEYLGDGIQPRVDGVIDARFEYDDDENVLSVWVLARGDRRRDSVVTHGTPEGWPIRWAEDIPEAARYYRLVAAYARIYMENLAAD